MSHPWATTPAINVLTCVACYKSALHGAGFEIIVEQNRCDFALATFAALLEKMADTNYLPTLGHHLVIEKRISNKMNNVIESVSARHIAPVELIARKI